MRVEKMNDRKKLLTVKNLKKYFPIKTGFFARNRTFLRAVDSVDLEIYEGETFGLVGESGSGKSTFGRTLLRLYEPTGGQVFFHQEEGETALTDLNIRQMRAFRKDLQIIFQDPYSSLNPRMTVGQLIAEGAVTHGYFKKGSAALWEYVLGVMRACGLQEHMLRRYPHQFSGGQRQRICIARALAVKPKFIVCDECVSALDVSIQSQILNLLSELKEREGLTYLFISHDLSVVRYISDRIAVMYLGKIVEMGDAEQIFENPRHPYTMALISAAPNIQAQDTEKILLEGQLPNPVSPPKGCPFHTRCFYAQELCQRVPAPVIEVEEGHFCVCHFSLDSTEMKWKKARKE